MNHRLRALLIVILSFASLSATAQNSSTANSAPGSKATPATGANASVPSEATVNAFLKKMFGWNQDLTWKVEEIKPSEASGIAQATVVFNTPRGAQACQVFQRQQEGRCHEDTHRVAQVVHQPVRSQRSPRGYSQQPEHDASERCAYERTE